jgi:hypothetical protein
MIGLSFAAPLRTVIRGLSLPCRARSPPVAARGLPTASKARSSWDFGVGAAERIRTSDPRITNALLYRLSYRGKVLMLLRFGLPSSIDNNGLLPDCYPFVPNWRFSNSCRNASSTREAASACIPGSTCEYKSNVIATVAWPSRSCAIFG